MYLAIGVELEKKNRAVYHTLQANEAIFLAVKISFFFDSNGENANQCSDKCSPTPIKMSWSVNFVPA